MISPTLTDIQFPMVSMFPRKLREAPSAGVKNRIFPLFNSSFISEPYNNATDSDDKGNLKPFARNTNRFKPRPNKGTTINFMLMFAIKNKAVNKYESKRKVEYNDEL